MTKLVISIIVVISTNSTNLCAKEFPIIVNNYDVKEEGTNEFGGPTAVATRDVYILHKNTLVDIDTESEAIIDISPPSAEDAIFPFISLNYTNYNGTPRNFLVGEFNESEKKMLMSSFKLVSPTLQLDFREAYIVADAADLIRDGNPISINSYHELPSILENKSNDIRILWGKVAQFHYKLDPPMPIDFMNLPEDAIVPLKNGEKLVQGCYELGGAIICGHKENGSLVLYRLSCSQNTYPKPIEVFNPDQKLTWDMEKSDAAYLSAFVHLRPDLLEHNTGTTENRMYVRMKPYHVKLDKPGETKAMRDWYLLAPFYDPATQTYRDTLTRQDFVADEGSGFDPNHADFDPSKFVRKLVPFTVPESFWNE